MNRFTPLAVALAALTTAPLMAQETPPADTETPAPADKAPAGTAPVDTTTPPTSDDATAAPVDGTTPPASDDTMTPPATTPTTPPADPMAAPARTPDSAAPSAPAAATAPGMTAEQKAAYDAWPANVRSYYDGLTASRQTLFLRIADADKVKLAGLSAAQQESTWVAIEKQDADQRASAAAAPQQN